MLEEITLADGTGGVETSRFIQTEILSRFGNPILSSLEDSSWVLDALSPLIITTDSYVVNPPVFPGGDIGKLAISGVINDLLASGAIPKYVTLSLILSEGTPLALVRQALDSISEIARAFNIKIVAGDTKVIEKNLNKIFINMVGIGTPISTEKNYSLVNAQPGDKIIVTGTIGDHGFSILSFREGLGFERRVSSDCAPLINMLLPIMKKFKKIHSMRDPTRGGLLGVLLDIVENSKNDILIDTANIPIRPEVYFGCEMLGLDPLHLVNEGKMVLVVGDEEVLEVLSALRLSNLGQEAAIIGEIKPSGSDQGKLLLRNVNGQIRIAIRPEGVVLPRLC